jgi:hypothetical protein
MNKVTPELEAAIKRMYVPHAIGYKLIAKRVGLSPSTVRRVLRPERAERDRMLSREAKRKRTGSCILCGGLTRYGGGDPPISRYCKTCAGRIGGHANRASNGYVYDALMALLAERGPLHMVEIRDGLGITTGHACSLLHRHRNYGTIVRLRRGVYALPPTTPTITERVQEAFANA